MAKQKPKWEQVIDTAVEELLKIAVEEAKKKIASGAWKIPSVTGDEQRSRSVAQLDLAYKTLGVLPTCSNDEVREAYRALARKHHPDRVARKSAEVQEAATRRFQLVQAAWDIVRASRDIR